MVDDGSECWNWTSALDTSGYGAFWLDGKSTSAHRLAWKIFNGHIPDGMLTLHKCDNPACVNPDHMFLGTDMDNMIDMDSKNRRSTGPRLKEGEVWLVRSLGKAGVAQRKIAKMFKVCQWTIWNILNRKEVTT